MKTVISVKVDQDIKEQVQEVAAGMGITLSALVNSYFHQVSASRRVELYAPEQMTPKLELLIRDVEKEIAAGKTSQGFTNADDFLADLKR